MGIGPSPDDREDKEMALYIEFHRKGTKDMAAGSGVALATVDDEMRAAFGADP